MTSDAGKLSDERGLSMEALSMEDDARLDAFLEELKVDRTWVTGFLAAIVTGPELIGPEKWIPEILDAPTFADADAAKIGFELLMRLYNDVVAKLEASPASICPNLDDLDAVREFCSGYFHGAKMHAAWRRDESAFLLIFVFAAIAGEVEEDLLRGPDDQPLPDPEAWRQKHREKIVDYVTELRDYWKNTKVPVRREGTKVGRNDPCPCGSGKKFKKCCGQ